MFASHPLHQPVLIPSPQVTFGLDGDISAGDDSSLLIEDPAPSRPGLTAVAGKEAENEAKTSIVKERYVFQKLQHILCADGVVVRYQHFYAYIWGSNNSLSALRTVLWRV